MVHDKMEISKYHVPQISTLTHYWHKLFHLGVLTEKVVYMSAFQIVVYG